MSEKNTRSGNPAKKAAAKKAAAKKTTTRNAPELTGPSDVASFKKQREGSLLMLPSSLVVRARRISLQNWIQGADGDVFNPLMAIVSETLEKGKAVDMRKITGDEDGKIDLNTIKDMYGMVNGVVMEMVVQPKIHPEPTEADLEEYNAQNPGEHLSDLEDLRDENLLYIDEVDDEDKMFLFQWAQGGTEDLATFRAETREAMATLA